MAGRQLAPASAHQAPGSVGTGSWAGTQCSLLPGCLQLSMVQQLGAGAAQDCWCKTPSRMANQPASLQNDSQVRALREEGQVWLGWRASLAVQ